MECSIRQIGYASVALAGALWLNSPAQAQTNDINSLKGSMEAHRVCTPEVHCTPDQLLLDAAAEGNPADIAQALKAGANIETRNKGGFTALSQAVFRDKLANVQLLVDRGADVNAQSNDEYTPLMAVHSVSVAQLLIQHGARVNDSNVDGQTALFFSATLDDPATAVKVAAFLLSHGARPDARALVAKITPIMAGIFNYNPGFVRLLIEHGANVNAVAIGGDGKTQFTALDLARVNRTDAHNKFQSDALDKIEKLLRDNGGIAFH